jgi:hypothetical protein
MLTEKVADGFINQLMNRYPVQVLKALLRDKTTKKNIVWADNEYSYLGHGFHADDQITVEKITGRGNKTIRPRTEKDEDRQFSRTKAHAEVFTPSWLCCRMNNYLDEEWFGVADVFNILHDRQWVSSKSPVEFGALTWRQYVDSRRLEITCGEAPFICSRYDTVTGRKLSVSERVGFLDRKLRVVSENAEDYETWLKWSYRALESTYGYEYQGDNLLVARINVLETFVENMQSRWNRIPELNEILHAVNIIVWNLWQMDGFTDVVAGTLPVERFGQIDLFKPSGEEIKQKVQLCRIHDWRANRSLLYADLKHKRSSGMKKFYAVIGNPPYQEKAVGDQKTYQKPIYPDFMDESYMVGEKVELVHPARFLFDAGSTPKKWNKKILQDKNMRVLEFQPDSSCFFPSLGRKGIKGGIAVTYRDAKNEIGPIGEFLPFNELYPIVKKVSSESFVSFSTIVSSRTVYGLTDNLYRDYPEAVAKLSRGHQYDMSTNIFDCLPELFHDVKPQDSCEYVQIYGRATGKRIFKWIRKKYVRTPKNGSFGKFKIVISKANGNGDFGEVISSPMILSPNQGHTETFIGVGNFDSNYEAESCLQYLSTKFTRGLLGAAKVTPDVTPNSWKYVPLQDFTDDSDIDWSESIPKIDQQLYKKYGLTDDEIDFIETHVKEMD